MTTRQPESPVRSQADEALARVIAAKADPNPVPPRDPAARRRFIEQRGW